MKSLFLIGLLLGNHVMAGLTSEIPVKREFILNDKVSPCEDFHKYVCSNTEENFKLRPDRSYHNFAFNDSAERILEMKKDFMLNILKEKNLSERANQFKTFYMSCMDTTSRQKDEKKQVEELKKEVAALKDIKSFVAYLNAQTFKGKNNLVGFGNINNQEDPKNLNLYLGSNLMVLSDQSYYQKPELMQEFQQVLKVFFSSVFPQLKAEEINKKVSRFIQVQNDFIKIYPESAVRRQRFSEKRDVNQVGAINRYNNLNLPDIFSKVSSNIMVTVPIPESLDFLNQMYTSENNLEVLKDIYIYDSLSEIMDHAYPKYFNAQFQFNHKFFGGPEKRSELQERCTKATNSYFGLEIDQLLIERKFSNIDEQKVQTIAAKIKESMTTSIAANQWLSKEAKLEASQKISKAKLYLVKPNTDEEWDFLPIQKYDKKHFLTNKDIYQKARVDKTLDELKKPANQVAWGMSPLTVNAYYSPSDNKFVLPIGILQFPFYDNEDSVTHNLGGVGAVIGHELGHGVDDQGAKYDSDGKLREWMSMKDLAEFSKRGSKMIEQFNKAGHNGKLTLGENIGDLVGLSFAYQSAFPKNEGDREDKKKFFISYARLWCTVMRPELKEQILKTNPHSLGEARINEQVKHQKGFEEAFQCKKGDAMTLPDSERIKIW